MRKMHPAVTAGLSAAFVIMAGTGAIVGVDTLLHGAVPTASADSESAGFKTTTTITSAPAWKNDVDTYGQFEVEGQFKVERTSQSIWGTGPFTVTCDVPTVWQNYTPTEGDSIQLDGKFIDWTVVSKPSNVSVSIPSESGDSHITINGSQLGLMANESVVITFKMRTTRNWGDSAPASDTINAILPTLGGSGLKIPDNISGSTGWVDYHLPGLTNEQFTLARTGASGDTTLVPGQSATGTFSATVSGNIYHAVVQQPTLSKPESGTGLEGINWATTPTKYVLHRGLQQTEHSFGDSVDLLIGDQITFTCEIATQGNMKIVASPVKLNLTITNTAHPTQSSSSKMEDWHKSSNDISVNLASLRTGVTLDRSRVSIGDAPLAATLMLAPSDPIPSATVVLSLTNVNSSVAPNSVGVAFAEASGVTLSENNTVARVNVTNLSAEQPVALQIPVSALSATTLSQLYANPNFKLTATLDESATTICTHDSTGNTASFSVNEPKMKGATTASDPALPAISEAHPDVTVNLGDAAQFETVFEPKEQDSLAILRGYQIKVNLASKDASGNALTASEAKTFLKEAPVIEVGSGDVWTPKAWTIKYYASKGGATVDAPTKASYFTVEPAEELAPGQKIKITYKATISSASVRNMRGGSVTAEPEFVPSGSTNYVGTGDTFTGATVNVATVQISPHLYVTEDEIAVGDKTTYMLTVQATRLSGASDNAAYALGLHATLALDDYSFGFGYAHNRDSIKVYKVDNGTTTEIEKGGTSGYTIDVDEENKTQCTISLPETSKIPVLNNLKDVNESKETGTAGGLVSGDDTGTTPSNNPTTEEASNSGDDTGGTSGSGTGSGTSSESDGATKTKLDVKGLATEIQSGYIITFEGTTDSIKSLTGVLSTNTDAAVRADNASFAVSSKNVNVKGGTPEEFVLKPYAEPTQDGGAGGSGGTNSTRTGTSKSDIPQLDASVPQVIAMMLGSAAAWWGARKWRNSKR